MTDAGTVFIAGGGGGIGAAVARTMVTLGHPVALLDLDVAGAATVAASITDSAFLELDVAAWDRTIAINLKGTRLVFQCAARRMIAGGRTGSFVALSSVAGRSGRANEADYAASKARVISVVRSAALALAPNGIRVNAVCPGVVDTPMTTAIHEQSARELGITQEESIAWMLKGIPRWAAWRPPMRSPTASRT